MEFDYDEYQKAVYYGACQEVVLICLDLINLCDINEILGYKNYLEMLPHAIEIWKESAVAFDMTDYVDVKHRLQLALLKYPTLRIVEDAPELIHLGERIYIQCAVTVFRDETDALPMRAYCWEVWPGRTPFTKDSEQPNGATSALGRALGYMGFGITTGLASADEVRTAQGNQHPSTQEPAPAEPAAPTKRVYSTYAQTQMDRKPEHSAPRGLATPNQIKLIETMSKERGLEPCETNGMTYAEATDEITRLKGIPRS